MIQNSRLEIYRCIIIALCVVFITACSVPSLEENQCREARNAAKAFYSFHFGKGFGFSQESLSKRESFLTEELKQELQKLEESDVDYFTNTDDYPKAFRIGKCEVIDANKSELEVVFFWSNDNRKEQKEIFVEMKNVSGNWLISKVAPKK